MVIWLAAIIDLSIDRSSLIARYGRRHDLRHLNGLAHPNDAVISLRALRPRFTLRKVFYFYGKASSCVD